MPDFDVRSLLGWFHFIFLVLAGGSMPVCLVLSGFEDAHEDIRGLSAMIWKKLTIWGTRFAVICGVILFVMAMVNGDKPFAQPHLMFKVGIGAVLIFLCENAPRSLQVGKRGYAMLALMLFIFISFIASNHAALTLKAEPPTPEVEAPVAPEADAPVVPDQETAAPVVSAPEAVSTAPHSIPAARQ
jgi:hypothetical protein